MDVFIAYKHIGGLKAYRKPIVATITIALLVGSFAGNPEHTYGTTPNEAAKISTLASTETEELSQRIKQLVKELEYSDKVAEDFAKMVLAWKDEQGQPVLVVWKKELNQARQDYKQAKISKDQLAKLEENIVEEISQKIQKEISPDFSLKFFDLADVIKHKQAVCLGYSQLAYIFGNYIGLSLQTIYVEELMRGELPKEEGHVAIIVSLTNGRTMMVDLVPGGFISRAFLIEKEFAKVGNSWQLKDPNNPLGIHRKIQILDRNGLIASIYNNRGLVYGDSGQFKQAISDYNKAIELDPKLSEAYTNRGNAYVRLGQLNQAISDCNKAIELNPKLAQAYSNRGAIYVTLGQHTQAISDCTKAIELNPKLSEAYNNRGFAYYNLGRLPQAISDYTKVIELDPKYAKAYYNRGFAYGNLDQLSQAISDYTKAIKLDLKYATAYCNRGFAYYKLSQLPQAIADYTTAIELNPKYAEAYLCRGIAYATLGKFEEAKRDLLKVIELNPALKPQVKKVSDNFKLNLELD
jgi:tetratricopeptide (TPR) repeat protein